NGEAKATLALLEEQASWSPNLVAMSAQESASGYVLEGTKLFVPDAGVADFFVCAARVGSELALFVVPSTAAGLRIEHMPSIDPTRPLYSTTFQRAQLSADALLARG